MDKENIKHFVTLVCESYGFDIDEISNGDYQVAVKGQILWESTQPLQELFKSIRQYFMKDGYRNGQDDIWFFDKIRN